MILAGHSDLPRRKPTHGDILAQLRRTAAADSPCHVPDCGQVRCDSCGERLTCTGAEPAVTCEGHTYCTDCETSCMWCKDARAERAFGAGRVL